MKIGIVTQPLLRNYGGILQNYALQTVLRQLGHTPVTVSYMPNTPLKFHLKKEFKRRWYNFFHSHKRPPLGSRFTHSRHPYFEAFAAKNMTLTENVYSYSPKLISKYGVEAVIVGSDQVWRPCYNQYVLTNMFLDFVKKQGVKKFAYGASFGVDNWEFTPKESEECSKLAQRLECVSVREESGIALCRDSLGVEAVEVLDPTLLLPAETYGALCTEVPQHKERYIAAYILDSTPEKVAFVEQVAKRKGIACKIYGADKLLELTVEEWLALLQNAEEVITDSFHGCVFSIIFRKEFSALLNSSRGAGRFTSLLGKFNLLDRIVEDPQQGLVPSKPIDWRVIETILKQWQELSINYLKKALQK